MAECRLTPAAEFDLEGIWRYTAQEWNVEQAHRYIDMLTTAFAELAEQPKTAPACDHIRPGYRRRCIEQHMIYFRITAYGIAIIRILHERMDSLRHL
ncbi:plasmid stabilization protein ParE [Pseudomonas fragi]|uniref:type II toxin-antitoxin system RelE/ParE family toxin n=1 Tax=Pseudomonas fragi TaxID=296 RepID=UPI000BA22F88|nr:type II toxin-antitoxin system RelE/ParE family toxin [Pseudomonas fragi]PAA22355.1 plasmid stabilization protein ParE [Pseudomonas fragi]